jgi:hypothetical protein
MNMHNKIGYRPTWAEIDLNNLAYNFNLVRNVIKPGTRILATVKADAYGHGLIPVSKKLVSCRADFLGVASIDEAYLDITQSQLLFKSPLHIAQSIKDRIRKREQLTCSIGIAPNKLLAKLGSNLQKPDGFVLIQKEKIEEIRQI